MNTFFTPGPSKLHDKVPQFIQEAIDNQILSISHRSSEFSDLSRFTVDNLRKLMNIPPEWKILYLPSATEAMERIIQNTVEKHSTHFVQGSFGERFWKTSTSLGKTTENIILDIDQMPYEYIDKIKAKTELICITQNETSTGSQIPFSEIKKIKTQFPDKLIAVDIVSSAPHVNVDFEASDLLFFSVQKAFGLPAGLGILAINPAAFAKSQTSTIKKQSGDFHDFANLDKYMQKYQTAETPNVLNIFLLGKVCEDYLNSNWKEIQTSVSIRAQELYNLFENIKNKEISINVKNSANRSETIIVINTGKLTNEIITKLKTNQIEIGNGYGDFKDTQVRIANFPTHTREEFDNLIAKIKSIF